MLGNPQGLLHCGAVCRGGVQKGTIPFAELSVVSLSLPPLPTSKLGPSGAESWVSGFVYILGSYGSPQRVLLRGWEFLPLLQPPHFFQSEVLRLYFPCAETLGCMVCLASQLFLPVYPHTNMGPLTCQPLPCQESSPPHLLISIPSTGQDECSFFNSLVIGLPFSLIFCQFWLFFIFKFVVILLLVV